MRTMRGMRNFKRAANRKSLLGDILIECPIGNVGQPQTSHDGCNAGHVVVCFRVVAFLDNHVEVGVMGIFSVYGEIDKSLKSF